MRRLDAIPPSYMRSIVWKLTFAFLLVAVLGVLLVAVLINRNTQAIFGEFAVRNLEQTSVRQLSLYYQFNRTWDNLEQQMRRGRPGQQDGPAWRRPFYGLLAEPDGRVILARPNDLYRPELTSAEMERAIPIKVDDEVVGLLLPKPPPDLLTGQSERYFLNRLRQAVYWGALAGATLALVVGVVLARTLAHPLRELKDATVDLAEGSLGRQVSVRSKDEIGQLAESFNSMSLQLAEANHLRQQMTADIAHDLRTPLSVILGYTEALHDGKLQGNADMYEVLHRQARHLSHLIDDLRTLSLADAGELPLHRQLVSSQELLEQAVMAHKVQADGRQISLTIRPGNNLPHINVDPNRITQVLGNLIQNALQYTESGGQIQLRTGLHNNMLAIEVEDNGSGIAEEDLPSIFERFYRADSTRTTEGSSGLGLPIAKSIVEAHGGTIHAASSLEHGTTFTVRLPVAS